MVGALNPVQHGHRTQAKGVLASTHGVGVNDAFDRMRDYARAKHPLLSGVARDVVTDPHLHPDLITTR